MEKLRTGHEQERGDGPLLGVLDFVLQKIKPANCQFWQGIKPGRRIAGAAYGNVRVRALVGPTVPDLRGLFLRGTGGNAAALGSVQGDAIRNITGWIYNLTTAYPSDHVTGAFASQVTSYTEAYHGSHLARTTHSMYFDASRVVPTAAENRPVNVAVRYLMRALP